MLKVNTSKLRAVSENLKSALNFTNEAMEDLSKCNLEKINDPLISSIKKAGTLWGYYGDLEEIYKEMDTLSGRVESMESTLFNAELAASNYVVENLTTLFGETTNIKDFAGEMKKSFKTPITSYNPEIGNNGQSSRQLQNAKEVSQSDWTKGRNELVEALGILTQLIDEKATPETKRDNLLKYLKDNGLIEPNNITETEILQNLTKQISDLTGNSKKEVTEFLEWLNTKGLADFAPEEIGEIVEMYVTNPKKFEDDFGELMQAPYKESDEDVALNFNKKLVKIKGEKKEESRTRKYSSGN